MSANIVLVNEELLRKDIKNLVKKTVQETLNALLDEEAAGLVGAEHYVRTAGREAYRGGHYARKLVTGAGGSSLACRNSAARPSDGRHKDTSSMSAYLLAVLRLAWGLRAISSLEASSASIDRMLRLCPGVTVILIKLLNCSCSQCSFPGNHSTTF